MGSDRVPDSAYSAAARGGVVYEQVETCLRPVRRPPALPPRRPGRTSLVMDDVLADVGRLVEPVSVAPCFVTAYEMLARDLTEESRLTGDGLAVPRDRLVPAMYTQMIIRELVETGELDPAVQGDDVLVVTGLPAAGTSRLQRLLNEHVAFNVPSLWELLSPVDDARPAFLTDAAPRAHLPALVSSGVRPGTPYGDGLLLSYAFHSPAASLEYRLPRYSEWLRHHDATTAYAFHRFGLNAILARVGGGVPVLADPFHAWRLDGLLASYPSATLVRLHEDPLRALTKVVAASLERRRAWSDQVTARDVVLDWAGQFSGVLASPAWRGGGGDALDITTTEFYETPMLAVRRICALMGVPVPSAVERRVMGAADRLIPPVDTAPIGDVAGVAVADLPAEFLDLRAEYCSRWGIRT